LCKSIKMADDKKVDSSDNFKAIMKSLYAENNSLKKKISENANKRKGISIPKSLRTLGDYKNPSNR
jgi:hypothetical protein